MNTVSWTGDTLWSTAKENLKGSIYTYSRTLHSSPPTYTVGEKWRAHILTKNQAQLSQTNILGHMVQAYIWVMLYQRNQIHVITDAVFLGHLLQFSPVQVPPASEGKAPRALLPQGEPGEGVLPTQRQGALAGWCGAGEVITFQPCRSTRSEMPKWLWSLQLSQEGELQKSLRKMDKCSPKLVSI